MFVQKLHENLDIIHKSDEREKFPLEVFAVNLLALTILGSLKNKFFLFIHRCKFRFEIKQSVYSLDSFVHVYHSHWNVIPLLSIIYPFLQEIYSCYLAMRSEKFKRISSEVGNHTWALGVYDMLFSACDSHLLSLLLKHKNPTHLVTFNTANLFPFAAAEFNLPQPASYVLNHGFEGKFDHRKFFDRLLNGINKFAFRFLFIINKMLFKYLLGMGDYDELIAATSLCFVNFAPILDEPVPLTSSIIYIPALKQILASQIANTPGFQTSNSIDSYKVLARPLVIITFGHNSLNENVPNDLKYIQVLHETFRRLPNITFIWINQHPVGRFVLPKNVIMRQSVPLIELPQNLTSNRLNVQSRVISIIHF